MSRQSPTVPVTAVAAQILLAEDDDALRALLRIALERRGYAVTESPDGLSLLDELTTIVFEDGSSFYDLVITDVRMPGVTGMEILRGMQGEACGPPFVLITAFGSLELHDKAARYGAVATLDKPFELAELLAVVENLVPRRDAAA